MQIIVRWLALWLLMSQMAAMAADVGRCAGTLSDEQRRYLQVCLDREAQCTDYWPGYPDDLADCVRLQKWLTKAMTMPPGMRHEIFGPVPEHVAGSPEEPAPSGKEAPPAWKSLPRSEDSAAPRSVAGPMTGVTASDYAGASSQLDPEQARAAGVAFWTGQIVQIAGIVAEANRAPAGSPRSFAVPITNAPRPVAAQTAFAEPPDSQTMNPGQLFAKADELNVQGDVARARDVQRALMSRFPDHPLAATTARQTAGPSPSSAPQGNRGSIGTPQTPASIPVATPGQSTRQQIDGGSGLVVRASQGALTPQRSGGRAIEPATLYAHRDLNFTSGDVGWIIATSAQEAAKAGEEEYGYSNLARAIRYGKTEDYLALDFGWLAFIDSYAESEQYPGHLSDNAKRVWAYAARSREEAISTAIREYENVRGNTVAQFVYSGLIAKIDRRDRGQVNCTVCKPDMLYRSFCSVGGKQGQFVKFLNRNPRLVSSQFEGALCETNASIPFMRAQENSPPPVLK